MASFATNLTKPALQRKLLYRYHLSANVAVTHSTFQLK
jgi:hypothetical protein